MICFSVSGTGRADRSVMLVFLLESPLLDILLLNTKSSLPDCKSVLSVSHTLSFRLEVDCTGAKASSEPGDKSVGCLLSTLG